MMTTMHNGQIMITLACLVLYQVSQKLKLTFNFDISVDQTFKVFMVSQISSLISPIR